MAEYAEKRGNSMDWIAQGSNKALNIPDSNAQFARQ
jgi:hypothetical protein